MTVGSALYLMFNVRKAAELGWEFGGAPLPVIGAGFVMWVLLMEALRRTGGWSLLWSVLPFTVYPLFADAGWLGPLQGQPVDRWSRRPPTTCSPARACSASRSRPSPRP